MADYETPRPISQPVGSTEQAVLSDNLITYDKVVNSPSGTEITNRKGEKITPLVDIVDGAESVVQAAIDQISSVVSVVDGNITLSQTGAELQSILDNIDPTSDLEVAAIALNVEVENVSYLAVNGIVTKYLFDADLSLTYSVPDESIGLIISNLSVSIGGNPAFAANDTDGNYVGVFVLTLVTARSDLEVVAILLNTPIDTVSVLEVSGIVTKHLFDADLALTYSVPDEIIGEVILSFSGATVVTSSGSYELMLVKTENTEVQPEQFYAVGDGVTDDTDAIDNSLQTLLYVKLVRDKTYRVRGGVLYTRAWQTLDLNGATIKLIDYIDDNSLKTIIEMDDHSSLINGTIDGNYQNNIVNVGDWAEIGDVPFAQGIYTSRFQTNSDVGKKSVGAYCDKITIKDTLRSSIVLTGSDQSHGEITCYNSYADHLLYFSGAENVDYRKAHLSGFCRAEAISLGTAGAGVPTTSPIDNVGGAVTVIKNVTKAPFISGTYDEDPIWIQGRNINSPAYLTFGRVYIDDVDSVHTSNGRRVAFSNEFIVDIGLLVIKSKITSRGSSVANAYFLDVRSTSDVTIGKLNMFISGDEALTDAVGAIRVDSGAACKIGALRAEIDCPNATNIRMLTADNTNITIDSLRTVQSSGELFRVAGTSVDSAINVQRIKSCTGFDTLENITRPGARNVAARVQILAMEQRKADSGASVSINAFNLEQIELSGSSSYALDDIESGNIGQSLDIIGDGFATKGTGGNITWLAGTDNATLADDTFVTLVKRYNGTWLEKA